MPTDDEQASHYLTTINDAQRTQRGKHQRFCRACWRDKSQRRRVEGLSSPDDSRHGTLAGYAAYGCRCEACRAARRTYNQRRREAVA